MIRFRAIVSGIAAAFAVGFAATGIAEFFSPMLPHWLRAWGPGASGVLLVLVYRYTYAHALARFSRTEANA